jgi:outer membrane protein OmpA-like peptidoglycan-associated protein
VKLRFLIVAGLCTLLAGMAQAQPVSICPDNFEAFAGTTEPLACTCSAEATRRGSVWGMDIYTGDSSICRAALHAGVIAARGGPVTVIPEAGRNAYPGVTRNGVQSSNYGSYASSFRFVADKPPTDAAGAPSGSPAPAPVAAASICPDNFLAFAGTTEPLACSCPAEATRSGSVWGMDVYTGDSSICRAALHAGVITARGGPATVIPEPGRAAYPGVTRNGVQSSNYGAYGSSFRFAADKPPAAAAPAPSGSPAPAAASSICPDNFEAYADTTESVICSCSAVAVKNGSVWGMDIYTGDSSVCRAALHAGVIGPNGGTITVIPEPGRAAYPGVTRNGVQSINYGAYRSSFRFGPGGPRSDAPARPPAAASAICPDNFDTYAGTTEPVECTCSAEAIKNGAVWGMDVYTGDSSVCRAALHAGVLAPNGGAVTAIPEPGRGSYAGVTRNGVQSINYGAYASSFRFAAPKQPVMIGDRPAQQAVATTLQATGQVQLYVQFRFNSAELDPSATPTLGELRDALNATPGLNLKLVGHTDAVGTPQYNQALSLRRAQSVMNWLAANGITSSRLSAFGKGRDEPIADNNTETGRALNRRVQAIRAQ